MRAPWSARRFGWTGALLVLVCVFAFYATMWTSFMRMTECRHFGHFEPDPCYAAAYWWDVVLGSFVGALVCFFMALRRRADRLGSEARGEIPTNETRSLSEPSPFPARR